MHGGVNKSYRIVVGKPELNLPLWGARRRSKENIKMVIKNFVRGFGVDSVASGFCALRTLYKFGTEPLGLPQIIVYFNAKFTGRR
jgi:hypothetical protein